MFPSRACSFITRVMPGITMSSTSNASKVLLVGLGNAPYPGTRHSVGHQIIDALAGYYGVQMNYDRATNSWIARTETTLKARAPRNKKGKTPQIEGTENTVELVLVKPKPLMNLSGRAVSLAYKAYARPMPLERLIVIHDSLQHKPFTTHTKFGGSANGHNGVRSVVDSLGTAEFSRIRVGIGQHHGDASDYVLEQFPSGERTFWSSTDACEKIVADIEALLSKSS